MSRDHHPSLRDVTADTENTAFSIAACWTVFTELLPGNAFVKSGTIYCICLINSLSLWSIITATEHVTSFLHGWSLMELSSSICTAEPPGCIVAPLRWLRPLLAPPLQLFVIIEDLPQTCLQPLLTWCTDAAVSRNPGSGAYLVLPRAVRRTWGLSVQGRYPCSVFVFRVSPH
jgi:hypothetical protein